MPPDRLTCEEAFRRLDDYLDRALSAEELGLVHRHLEECASCAREYRFEAALLAEIRAKLQRLTVPEGLLQRLTDRLRQVDDRVHG